ncbi:DUF3055 domain-containing protein [Paenibacillus sp.]|uniref:DUF3055 domain-containing protein n=1 Tax=Paenibacillus sp. TaxID=58172 RepID=UPI002D2E8EBE|nr:DUF3055 domain-containing protein [Paenibacillus sp.]HZG85459.1 DUF3055 domain-containing protein [Paenibacillus sp.]
MFDRLYDESEQTKVDFFGYATERARYDFAIVYTNRFFGKPLVVCMQTGRSSLLSADDLANTEHLQRIFSLSGAEEAEDLAVILRQRLPHLDLKEQY